MTTGSFSVTAAPCCKGPTQPGPSWLRCYITLATPGILGREWSLRGPQTGLLDLMLLPVEPEALNSGDKVRCATRSPNCGDHPGHTQVCAPHLHLRLSHLPTWQTYSFFTNHVMPPLPPLPLPPLCHPCASSMRFSSTALTTF